MLYKLVNELLYFDDDERDLRLYVSTAIEAKVFRLIYNKIEYLGYVYTYKKLTKELYIFNIAIKLYKFIRYYPYY